MLRLKKNFLIELREIFFSDEVFNFFVDKYGFFKLK